METVPDGIVTYNINGTLVKVPESKVSEFIKGNPSAFEIRQFSNGKDVVKVPATKIDEFRKGNPDFKPDFNGVVDPQQITAEDGHSLMSKFRGAATTLLGGLTADPELRRQSAYGLWDLTKRVADSFNPVPGVLKAGASISDLAENQAYKISDGDPNKYEAASNMIFGSMGSTLAGGAGSLSGLWMENWVKSEPVEDKEEGKRIVEENHSNVRAANNEMRKVADDFALVGAPTTAQEEANAFMAFPIALLTTGLMGNVPGMAGNLSRFMGGELIAKMPLDGYVASEETYRAYAGDKYDPDVAASAGVAGALIYGFAGHLGFSKFLTPATERVIAKTISKNPEIAKSVIDGFLKSGKGKPVSALRDYAHHYAKGYPSTALTFVGMDEFSNVVEDLYRAPGDGLGWKHYFGDFGKALGSALLFHGITAPGSYAGEKWAASKQISADPNVYFGKTKDNRYFEYQTTDQKNGDILGKTIDGLSIRVKPKDIEGGVHRFDKKTFNDFLNTSRRTKEAFEEVQHESEKELAKRDVEEFRKHTTHNDGKVYEVELHDGTQGFILNGRSSSLRMNPSKYRLRSGDDTANELVIRPTQKGKNGSSIYDENGEPLKPKVISFFDIADEGVHEAEKFYADMYSRAEKEIDTRYGKVPGTPEYNDKTITDQIRKEGDFAASDTRPKYEHHELIMKGNERFQVQGEFSKNPNAPVRVNYYDGPKKDTPAPDILPSQREEYTRYQEGMKVDEVPETITRYNSQGKAHKEYSVLNAGNGVYQIGAGGGIGFSKVDAQEVVDWIQGNVDQSGNPYEKGREDKNEPGNDGYFDFRITTKAKRDEKGNSLGYFITARKKPEGWENNKNWYSDWKAKHDADVQAGLVKPIETGSDVGAPPDVMEGFEHPNSHLAGTTPENIISLLENGGLTVTDVMKHRSRQKGATPIGAVLEAVIKDIPYLTLQKEEVDLHRLFFGGMSHQMNAYADQIPLYQGSKTARASRIQYVVVRAFNEKQRAGVNTIYEPFGGGGGYGLYFANTTYRNVKNIYIGDFDPANPANDLRVKKIELLHKHGDKIGLMIENEGLFDPQLPVEEWGSKDAPILNRAMDRATQSSNVYGKELEKGIDAVMSHLEQEKDFNGLTDQQKVILFAVRDLLMSNRNMVPGSEKDRRNTLEHYDINGVFERLKKNGIAAHDAYSEYEARGGKVVYGVRDAFADEGAWKYEPGADKLVLLDPPYFNTAGYDKGNKLVGADMYMSVHGLVGKLMDNGNNIIYNDAFWPLQTKLPKQHNSGPLYILNDFKKKFTTFGIIADKLFDEENGKFRRQETLGIYNPVAGSAGSKGIHADVNIGERKATGFQPGRDRTDQAQPGDRVDGVDGEQGVRSDGLPGTGSSTVGAVSTYRMNGLRFEQVDNGVVLEVPLEIAKKIGFDQFEGYTNQYGPIEKHVPEKVAPTVETAQESVDRAAAETNTNPTEAQKQAGNYKKGKVKIGGMTIAIENPIGSVRSWKDEDGKAWEHTMKSHYGYFDRTKGKDGDEIDAFIGPNPESEKIFVIDQVNPKDGKFDESKVMVGYDTAEEAKAAYLENYDKDWQGFDAISEVGIADFKKWLGDGQRQNKAFFSYKDTPLMMAATNKSGKQIWLQDLQENRNNRVKFFNQVSEETAAENSIYKGTHAESVQDRADHIGYNPLDIFAGGVRIADVIETSTLSNMEKMEIYRLFNNDTDRIDTKRFEEFAKRNGIDPTDQESLAMALNKGRVLGSTEWFNQSSENYARIKGELSNILDPWDGAFDENGKWHENKRAEAEMMQKEGDLPRDEWTPEQREVIGKINELIKIGDFPLFYTLDTGISVKDYFNGKSKKGSIPEKQSFIPEKGKPTGEDFSVTTEPVFGTNLRVKYERDSKVHDVQYIKPSVIGLRFQTNDLLKGGTTLQIVGTEFGSVDKGPKTLGFVVSENGFKNGKDVKTRKFIPLRSAYEYFSKWGVQDIDQLIGVQRVSRPSDEYVVYGPDGEAYGSGASIRTAIDEGKRNYEERYYNDQFGEQMDGEVLPVPKVGDYIAAKNKESSGMVGSLGSREGTFKSEPDSYNPNLRLQEPVYTKNSDGYVVGDVLFNKVLGKFMQVEGHNKSGVFFYDQRTTKKSKWYSNDTVERRDYKPEDLKLQDPIENKPTGPSMAGKTIMDIVNPQPELNTFMPPQPKQGKNAGGFQVGEKVDWKGKKGNITRVNVSGAFVDFGGENPKWVGNGELNRVDSPKSDEVSQKKNVSGIEPGDVIETKDGKLPVVGTNVGSVAVEKNGEIEFISNIDVPKKSSFVRISPTTDKPVQLSANEEYVIKRFEEERQRVETELSSAREEARNHRMGHVRIYGMPITIQYAKGMEVAKSPKYATDAKEGFKFTPKYDYGSFPNTQDARIPDFEKVDADGNKLKSQHVKRENIKVTIGPDPMSEKVYVIDRVNDGFASGGNYNLSRVMMGFKSEAEARKAFMDSYPDGTYRVGAVKSMGMADFKQWVYSDNTVRPAAYKWTMPREMEAVFSSDGKSVSQLHVVRSKQPDGSYRMMFVDKYGRDGRRQTALQKHRKYFFENHNFNEGLTADAIIDASLDKSRHEELIKHLVEIRNMSPESAQRRIDNVEASMNRVFSPLRSNLVSELSENPHEVLIELVKTNKYEDIEAMDIKDQNIHSALRGFRIDKEEIRFALFGDYTKFESHGSNSARGSKDITIYSDWYSSKRGDITAIDKIVMKANTGMYEYGDLGRNTVDANDVIEFIRKYPSEKHFTQQENPEYTNLWIRATELLGMEPSDVLINRYKNYKEYKIDPEYKGDAPFDNVDELLLRGSDSPEVIQAQNTIDKFNGAISDLRQILKSADSRTAEIEVYGPRAGRMISGVIGSFDLDKSEPLKRQNLASLKAQWEGEIVRLEGLKKQLEERRDELALRGTELDNPTRQQLNLEHEQIAYSDIGPVQSIEKAIESSPIQVPTYQGNLFDNLNIPPVHRTAEASMRGIHNRAFIDGFRESGKMDIKGLQVYSYADIATMFAVHRSPFIENIGIYYTKGSETLNYRIQSMGRVYTAGHLDYNKIYEEAKHLGADGVTITHNHPSGNHKPSTNDQTATKNAAETFHQNNALYGSAIEFNGHIVTNHKKYTVMLAAGQGDPSSIARRFNVKPHEELFPEEQPYFYKSRKQITPFVDSKKYTPDERVKAKENAQKQQIRELAGIGNGLMSRHESPASIIYLSTDNKVNGYDVMPRGVSGDFINEVVKRGLGNNLGYRAVIVHDGSMRETMAKGIFTDGLWTSLDVSRNDVQFVKTKSVMGEGKYQERWVDEIMDNLPDITSEVSSMNEKISEIGRDKVKEILHKSDYYNSVDAFSKKEIDANPETHLAVITALSKLNTIAQNDKIPTVIVADKWALYNHLVNVDGYSKTDALSAMESIAYYAPHNGKTYFNVGRIIRLASMDKNDHIPRVAAQLWSHEVAAHAGIDLMFNKNKVSDGSLYKYVSENINSDRMKEMLPEGYHHLINSDPQRAAMEYVASLSEHLLYGLGEYNLSDRLIFENVREMINEKYKSVFDVDSELTDKEIAGVLLRSLKNIADPNSPNFTVPRDMPAFEPLSIGVSAIAKTRGPEPEAEKRMITPWNIAKRINRDLAAAELSVSVMQDKIKKSGGIISDHGNIDNHLNTVRSKVQYELDQVYHKKIWKPFHDVVTDITSMGNVTSEELMDYQLALFTRERTIKGIDSMNPDPDARWGIKEVDAAINNVEQKVKPWNLERLHRVTKEHSDYVLKNMWIAGFLSDEAYSTIKDKYDNYVPLRGWEFEEGKDPRENYDYISDYVESNYNNPLVRAHGRSSKPSEPWAMMRSIAETAIAAGERNKAKQSLGVLISENPQFEKRNKDGNKYLYEAAQVWAVRRTLPDGTNQWIEQYTKPSKAEISAGIARKYIWGLNVARPSGVTDAMLQQSMVNYWKDGIKYRVAFPDPEVARSINMRNQVKAGSFIFSENTMKYLSSGARGLAQLSTAKNPVFIPVNFIRDFQYATIAHAIKNPGDMGKFLNNVLPAVGAINAFRRGKLDMTNPKHAEFELWQKYGGPTGFMSAHEFDYYKRLTEKEVARMSGQVRKFGKGGGSDIMHKIGEKTGARWIGIGLEYAAYQSENITRFATYLSARERGLTVESAVQESKNIVVNFDYKGRLSPVLNGMYMFFNANMRGVANFTTLLMQNPVRTSSALAAMMAAGYYSNNHQMGQDDDGLYERQNDWKKHNNIVMRFGDKLVTIPLPPGFRALYGLGVIASQIESGQKTKEEGMLSAVSIISENFSPFALYENEVKDGKVPFRAFVPTLTVPAYDVARNTDFKGSTIYKPIFDPIREELTPMTNRGMKGVNPLVQTFTDNVNKILGGDDIVSGKFNYDPVNQEWEENKIVGWAELLNNPSIIEHTLEYYTGGVGKFANQTFKTGRALGSKLLPEVFKTPYDIKPYEVPFGSRFVTWGDQSDPISYSKRFYEYHKMVEEFKTAKSMYMHNVMSPEYLEKGSMMGKDPQFASAIKIDLNMQQTLLELKKKEELIKTVEDYQAGQEARAILMQVYVETMDKIFKPAKKNGNSN